MQAAGSLDCLCTGGQQAPQAKGLTTVLSKIELHSATAHCTPLTTVSCTASSAGEGCAAFVYVQWLDVFRASEMADF